MRRRDLIVGSACVAAAGLALFLTPARRLSRKGGLSLEQVSPRRVGDWSARDVSGLASPSTDEGLVAKLYDEVLERIYSHATTGDEVMMLLAHGSSQTEELQLHRPETCYPAFGFALSEDQPVTLPISTGVSLPARRFVADAAGQRECVLYWSRIGDFLPDSDGAQRMARLRSAMEGFVCDGLLARFSIASPDVVRSQALLEQFVPNFLAAVGSSARAAFVGAPLAERMTSKV